MLKSGDQIIYIPHHARGARDHPDVEYGFVTSVPANHSIAFCRYWSKVDPRELRTKANGEATPMESLQLYKSKHQETINDLINFLKNGGQL